MLENKQTCKYCSALIQLVFTPFQNIGRRSVREPLYYFHIGAYCSDLNCGKFNGWKKQTVELMNTLKGAILLPITHEPARA